MPPVTVLPTPRADRQAVSDDERFRGQDMVDPYQAARTPRVPGSLKAGSYVYNATRVVNALVESLGCMPAAEEMSESAGDIVAAEGSRTPLTGDTLCDEHNCLGVSRYSGAVISVAVEPRRRLMMKSCRPYQACRRGPDV